MTSARQVLNETHPVAGPLKGDNDLLSQVQGIVKLEPFENLFLAAYDAGMDGGAMTKISAALASVGEAVGIAFVGDLAAGQLPALPNNTGIDSLVPTVTIGGSPISGKAFNYVLSDLVGDDGVSVELDITFSFPRRNPGFLLGDGSTTVEITGMEVSINTFKVGLDSVWITAEQAEPAMTVNLVATLNQDSDGGIVSADIYEAPPLVSVQDMRGKIEDNQASVSLTFAVTGEIESVTGKVEVEDASAESKLELKANDFVVDMQSEGL